MVPPLDRGRMPVTSLLARFTALEVRTPELFAWRMPVERPEKVMVPEEVSWVRAVRAVV